MPTQYWCSAKKLKLLAVDKSLSRLSKSLAYQFRDEALLNGALTHRSVGDANNERLEFLGDAILNFVIASNLYSRFPKASEGELSRLRALLVKGETLAQVGRDLLLGEYLRLGAGELKSGGFRRDSILADAVEAILGAVYLDGGFDQCKDLIGRLFAVRIDGLDLDKAIKDPKTKLQEYLQSRKIPLPEYEVVEITGEAHDQKFFVACKIEGVENPLHGSGASRRKAEQQAAVEALLLFGVKEVNDHK